MGSVASTVSSVVESVGNAASNVAETVGDVASDAAQVVSNVADKADNFVQGGAWDPGGVFYSVGDAVSSVGKPIGDAFQTVGQVAGDTAKAVGEAGADLDKVVGREIPGGWITVGLVAGTIATAGALGAGTGAGAGASAGASAAEAATAATTFAGASSTTAASVATSILEGAATGALKGAAVGGIKSVLEGDSILEGALSGGASGALGGSVYGLNQTLDFNPFVEQAMGNMVKAAASPRGLEKSLDKIAFNAAAGYLGNEIGMSPSAAVPLANVARAAAEGKDVNELIKKQALNYAVGQVAGPVKDALGNVAGEIKDAVGFGGGEGGEEAPEDLTAMDKTLNFAQNATESAVKDYLKDQINKPPTPPVRTPSAPTTPRMSAQQLMDQGYSWDADRKVWKRPIPQTTAATTPVADTAQPTNQFNYADTASDLSNEMTPEQYTEMKYKALNDYVDPYASLANKNATLSGSADINDIGFSYNEPNTQYQIDKSMGAYVDPQEAMGEYVDPELKKKVTTNLMASGLPVQAGFAEGGTTGKDKETENNEFIDRATENVFRYIRPGVTHGNANYNLPGYPFGQLFRIGMAQGGAVEGHNPQFFSEGGLNSLGNTYVKGDGDGTSDSIPAMLANGEFVIPADIVSGLGNGSNDSGAKVLDEFLKTIRKHKQKTGADKLPPDSKGPLGYLLEAKRKMKV